MGQTVKQLSCEVLDQKAVFNNRFVIELCESVHVHYRNLRIVLDVQDFVSIAKGFQDALSRWIKRTEPEPSAKRHIELCRKDVAGASKQNEIQVNLNRNLYPQHDGKIFAEGADIEDPLYVHLKIRDLRIEMSKAEFIQLARAVRAAEFEIVEVAM